MTYSLYSVFSDLVVTSDDILEADLLAQQILQAYYPTLDLREGSALRDILIRPTSTLLALIAKGMDKHLLDNRIDGVTDSTPTSTVDSVMSNLFLNRRQGSKARAVVRVKFSTLLPTDTVTVSTSAFFSVDNVNKFKPVQNYYLSKTGSDSSTTLLTRYTSISEDYYYADILCESDGEGDQFNIPGGSEFLYFTVFDPYFVGAKCIAITQTSVSTETNTSFVARAPEAITTRNLINNISIPARLNAEFNYLKEIFSSGYSDYEMMRDYREITTPIGGANIPVHMGGYVDIYLRTTLKETVVQVTTNSSGVAHISGVDPVVRITTPSVGESSTTNLSGTFSTTNLLTQSEVAGYLYSDDNYDGSGVFYENESGFSAKQNIRIYRSGVALPPNSSFDIKVLQWTGISSVQSYLDDVSSRVVCANYIARGFAVVDLDCTLYVQGTAPTGDALTALQDAIKLQVATYVDAIPYADTFVVAEALKYAVSAAPLYKLSNQVDVTYSLYDGFARTAVPIGAPGMDGIINSSVVQYSSGHDETSSIKVARAYMFRVNSVRVEGI